MSNHDHVLFVVNYLFGRDRLRKMKSSRIKTGCQTNLEGYWVASGSED